MNDQPSAANSPVEQAPIALLFHENSKISRSSLTYLAETVAEFSEDVDQVRLSTTSAKTYPGAERIRFDDVRRCPRLTMRLAHALARRRSVRRFSDRPVELATLISILKNAYGVTGQIGHPEHAEIVQPLRAAPSGGALYPIELYVAALNVDGLSDALYHVQINQRCLELCRPGPVAPLLEPLVLMPYGRLDAPCLLILTARWERPLTKYSERGYRFVLLDAGHVAQNVLLVATSVGLGGLLIGGFLDDDLADALRLDPRQEPVIYVIALGWPA